MSFLTVRHSTVYRYREPVGLGEHRMLFRPRESHDLRLIRTNFCRFHTFTPDSDLLRHWRSPEVRGWGPETAGILGSSILGTPLFNTRLSPGAALRATSPTVPRSEPRSKRQASPGI